MKYTDGLVVENVRLRNNLADGVNFAQGTKNSIVRNSSIRGNGDDGLASWSSIADGTESAVAENNKFLTIRLNSVGALVVLGSLVEKAMRLPTIGLKTISVMLEFA